MESCALRDFWMVMCRFLSLLFPTDDIQWTCKQSSSAVGHSNV